MKKHIFIAIRYSILQKNSAAWRATESSFEEYAAKILHPDRLDIRENTFEYITLQSLCNQTINNSDVTYSVLIMISDILPEDRVNRLKRAIDLANTTKVNFDIVKIDSGTDQTFDHININEAIKSHIRRHLEGANDTVIATVRLDDDDGLSENYIEKLSTHMRSGLTGYAVSFAYGIEGYWDTLNNEVSDLRHSYFPKCAQGLAYINEYSSLAGLKDSKTIHVYNLGNHMKIDETYPTIIEAIEPMFFRTLSSTNDSVGSPYHRNMPLINGRNSISQFNYIERLYKKHQLPEHEDTISLEICKSSSPWSALIKHLNNRIQLREKQIRELTARLNGETL